MATRDEKTVGLSLAAAGVGIIGAAVVFGPTTTGGGPDWVRVITVIAGLVMTITGLVRAFRARRAMLADRGVHRPADVRRAGGSHALPDHRERPRSDRAHHLQAEEDSPLSPWRQILSQLARVP